MYTSIQDIIAANKAHGGHFFDKDSMRFFKSRVLSHVVNYDGMAFFITSERNEGSYWSYADNAYVHYDSGRKYTVRMIDGQGDIRTHGEFMQHRTIAEARKAIDEVVRGWSYADTGILVHA